jgi:hypothetical protein
MIGDLARINARLEELRKLLRFGEGLNSAGLIVAFAGQAYFARYGFIPSSIESVRKIQGIWSLEISQLVRERSKLLAPTERQAQQQVTNRAVGLSLGVGNGSGTGLMSQGILDRIQGKQQGSKNPDERIQNVGMVTEAYFSPLTSFAKTFNLQTNNRPRVIQQAEQLWETSAGNKGIIQSFVPRSGLSSYSFNAALPSDVKTNTQSRFGFQFHYNPGSIDMTYAGIPDIDVGYVGSGEDVFNLVGSQVSQASISFQLILNRVFDMQYYTAAGQLRSDSPPSLYSPQKPSAKDQEQIYNRGTMYDVEFLLSSILGFRAGTQFRGNTADLGWIGGHPVELFLGKSLKYLAMTQGASLRHIIFNERMVPTFSTLSLTFNRIPDYATSGDSGATGASTRDAATPPPPTTTNTSRGRFAV